MQSEPPEVIRSRLQSLKRVSLDFAEVGRSLDSRETSRRLRDLTRPASPVSAFRNAGIALAVAPEPITTVAGVGMVAASFLLKSREPADLADLAEAAKEQLDCLSAISLADLSVGP